LHESTLLEAMSATIKEKKRNWLFYIVMQLQFDLYVNQLGVREISITKFCMLLIKK
jgi:hypothetical protein